MQSQGDHIWSPSVGYSTFGKGPVSYGDRFETGLEENISVG